VTAAAPFRHRPPSLLRQWALGLHVYGVLAPTVWALERLRLSRKAFSCVLSRRERAIAAADPLATYAAGPQDVFVATPMKSGTNWMMQIALQLVHHGEAEFEHVHDVVPWPETAGMASFLRRYAVPLEDARTWRDAPERKRVVKTHRSLAELPISDAARYLVVLRDPKDVFVSSYHFVRDGLLGPAMPSVDTWFRLFVKGKTPGGHWARHAADAWARRHRKNVGILSFKEMKRDLPGTVRRVAEVLDVRVPDAVIARVVERSTFEAMKRIDEKFSIGRLIPWKRGGAMLRRGAQGGSSELLTLERQREIDATFQADLRKAGSDLPYERFADLA
jgi:hypothetical protein